MNIQWYPGHMTKTRRMMQANMPLVDVVIELLDARIPYSSKNPDMDELARNKRRLILLNKADLADANITRQWENHYRACGFEALAISATEKKIGTQLADTVRTLMSEKISKEKKRGRLTVNIRAMVVGIPNVGKSTLINRLSGAAGQGGAPTTTGDKPGVTRGKQWIKVAKDFDLLDTPGVLWPKFEDKIVGERLAFTGAINDTILDVITLSELLIAWFVQEKPDLLISRYKIPEETCTMSFRDILENIGAARGFKAKGGVIDLERTANTLLDEFRAGKLGRITLDKPSDY
ncbi:MAG: ribosome biogenesis GTPase YlqF [Defluviitaleaceae bacterium]|nr:ribosome biogenesis GTPase YlqF [Defluviitaleaceae bacterium]